MDGSAVRWLAGGDPAHPSGSFVAETGMVLVIESTNQESRSSLAPKAEETRMTTACRCESCLAAEEYRKGIDRERNMDLICERSLKNLERHFAKRRIAREVAEGRIQETLLTVSEKLDDFRGQSCVSTWITTIAENRLKRFWAKHGKSNQTEIDSDESPVELEEPSPSAEEAALLEEVRRLVRAEVKKLPPRMRLCVEYFYYQDLSYQQIAMMLRIEVGAVGAHLSNAKQKLKKALGDRIDIDRELR